MKKTILKLSLCLLVFGCATPSNQSVGFIKLGVQFPNSGFSIKAIPNETEKIEISISGEGLNEPIKKEFSRSETKAKDDKVLLEKIPTGKKTIAIKALSKEGVLLAEASEETEIESGKLKQLTIELKELLKKLKLSLSNYPSDGDSALIEIKSGETTLTKEFKGNSIEFDKLKGKVKVRVSVVDKDAMPIATSSDEIDLNLKNEVNLNLDKLIIDQEDVDIDINAFIPSNLKAILDKTVIKVSGNNPPSVDKVTLKVNGTEREVPPAPNLSKTAICVNENDDISIVVDTSDTDGDKVNFFWAKTSPNQEQKGRFKVNLLPEKSNILSRRVNFPVGTHSLGFVITDRKSIGFPYTLYFNVTEKPCK